MALTNDFSYHSEPHPGYNIYPIYDLLELVKGLVPCNDNCRISMTQDSSRISKRNFNEGPVSDDGLLETLSQTNDSL